MNKKSKIIDLHKTEMKNSLNEIYVLESRINSFDDKMEDLEDQISDLEAHVENLEGNAAFVPRNMEEKLFSEWVNDQITNYRNGIIRLNTYYS